MTKPALIVVDDDPQVLAAVRRDLRSHYQQHYTIISASSGEEALTTIKELKSRGDSLAMVISDQRMPGLQGTDVLAQARDSYPLAKRVLLTAYSDNDATVKAINVAHLDHYLSKPWDPPEECLFPIVDDLLDSWQDAYLPEDRGLRLIGHQWSPRSHVIKDFLSGNLIPYRWFDVARNPESKSLLEAKGILEAELPALFFEDGSALRNPEPREVAERLGRSVAATRDLYDLVIAGAGPSGLAAAVYGASEGLRTLLLDRHAPGGQAGTSSKIENYLGFPTGISGQALAGRAQIQAQKFGARLAISRPVVGVDCSVRPYRVRLDDGTDVMARSVVISSGARYRTLEVPNYARYEGHGIHYAATAIEARLCARQEVVLVGGGNSAGQAAVFLARIVARVYMLVRGDRLSESMSDYLIQRINASPKITLLTQTEIVALEGERSLEGVVWTCRRTGETTRKRVFNVFVMIGAVPSTRWLGGCLRLDDKGFVLTAASTMNSGSLPPGRSPFVTSIAGVYAVGDVRSGSVKRVASAVGEGSACVQGIHQYLGDNTG